MRQVPASRWPSRRTTSACCRRSRSRAGLALQVTAAAALSLERELLSALKPGTISATGTQTVLVAASVSHVAEAGHSSGIVLSPSMHDRDCTRALAILAMVTSCSFVTGRASTCKLRDSV